MMPEPSPTCPWCGKPFTPRLRGGSRQTFCGTRCRQGFHAGARRWAERAVECGALTVADLRNADPAACTLARGYSGDRDDHRAPHGALVAHGPLRRFGDDVDQ
jgi:hypothetical protein